MVKDPTGGSGDRRHGKPTHERLTSVEAVLADGNLTPAQKLDRLVSWDSRHGGARPEGHGRIADAVDLGFPDPAPYSGEVQRSIVELYRLHRKDLPPPEDGPWAKGPAPATDEINRER